MAENDRPRFESHLKKHLASIRHNLYINPSDPLYFEKVLRYIDAGSPEAHLRLGEKYEQTGNMAKAQFHYEKAKEINSPYYYEAKKALNRLREPSEASNKGNKTPSKRAKRFTQSVIITLILLNLILLFLLWNRHSQTITPIGEPILFSSIEQPEQVPLTAIGANFVRTAIEAYRMEKGKAPETINQLLGNYPDNYLSFIPKEPITGSNLVVAEFNGAGGWVYEKEAADIESMFYPNLSIQALESIPYESMQITVSKADYQLQLTNGDWVLESKPVGLGKENRTPEGAWSIQDRVQYPEGRNPGIYGEAGLAIGQLAIHGTYEADSIGGNQSLGCIRMRNEDIQAIFPLVPKGTTVEIMANRLNEQTQLSPLSLQPLIPESIPKHKETAVDKIFDWLG